MMSKEESKGDSGVEVMKNEKFRNDDMGEGWYTKKVYHFTKRFPGWVQMLLPTIDIIEESWNAFPKCKTRLSCSLLGEKFYVEVISNHIQDAGTTVNPHSLPKDKLKNRNIQTIDIAFDKHEEYKPEEDPKLVKLTKPNPPRGPLSDKNWMEKEKTMMCCYKMVTTECRIWPLQGRLEQYIQSINREVFLRVHRKMYAWADKWFDMTLEEVKKFEADVEASINAKYRKSTDSKSSHKDVNVQQQEEVSVQV